MTSEFCKEGLAEFFSGTNASDWKRRSKVMMKPWGTALRGFENEKTQQFAFVADDDDVETPDEIYAHEAGLLYYTALTDKRGIVHVSFVAKTMWEREGCIPDQCCGYVLQWGCGIPKEIIDNESSENDFQPKISEAEVRAILDNLPNVEEGPESLRKMMKKCYS